MDSWWFMSGAECGKWTSVKGPLWKDSMGSTVPLLYQVYTQRLFFNPCCFPSRSSGSFTTRDTSPEVDVLPPPELRSWLNAQPFDDPDKETRFSSEIMSMGSNIDYEQDCCSLSLDFLTSPCNDWLALGLLTPRFSSQVSSSSMLVSFSSLGCRFPVLRIPGCMISKPSPKPPLRDRDLSVKVGFKVVKSIVTELERRDVTIIREHDDLASYVRSKVLVSPSMTDSWAKKYTEASFVTSVWASIVVTREGSLGYYLRFYIYGMTD